MKVLQRFNLNLESACMTAFGILALLAAAAKPWWRLLGFAEPAYFKLDRLLCAIMAIVIAYCVLTVQRYRVSALITAGLIALLLPFVTTYCLVTLDAKRIDTAVMQFNTTSIVIAGSRVAEINTEVPWTDGEHIQQQTLGRNDYTLSDSIATVFHFVQPGFLIVLIAGACLIVAAWTMNAPATAYSIRRIGLRAAACFAAVVIVASIPEALGFAEWNLGRRYQELGEYPQALTHYNRAKFFDKRIDYDIFFHFNMGQIYAALRDHDEPDYWAWVGDNYFRGGDHELAASIYETHITDPNANPALAVRYAQMMFMTGAMDYNLKSFGLANRRLSKALEVSPTNLEYAYWLAIAQTQEGDYPRAIREWKAIIIDNENVGMYRSKYFTSNIVYRKTVTAQAWRHLAWCYYKENNLRDAMASLTNAQTGGKMPLPTMNDAPIQTWTHS